MREVASMLTFDCLGCGRSLRLKHEYAGRKVKCPKCGCVAPAPRELPQSSGFQRGFTSAAPPRPLPCHRSSGLAEITETARPLSVAKRFLSLPWLILIGVFGFLPFAEVSCTSKDTHWSASQSGYQALYGGVSSPFDSLAVFNDVVLQDMNKNKQLLSK